MAVTDAAEVTDFLIQSDPLLLVDFLVRTGWQRLTDSDPRRSYWLLEDQNGRHDASLMLPLDRQFSDHDLRMREVALQLSRAHGEDWETLLVALLSFDADLIRLRSDQALGPDGSVCFEEGAELLDQANSLLRSAAKATEQKRPYFGQRAAPSANRYAAHLRLAQSSRGSYTFNFLSPVGESVSPPVSGRQELPFFGRRVTVTLFDALKSAKDAAASLRTSNDFAPFMDAVSFGVSSDMCEALVRLITPASQERLQISVHWAKRAPEPHREATEKVEFDRADLSPLSTARQRLRSTDREAGVTVTGIVRQLRREEIKEGSPVVVSVAVTESSREDLRNVRVRLDWSQVHDLVSAFDESATVRIRGDLEKDGNFYWLYNTSEVQVITAGTAQPTDPTLFDS